MDRPLRQFEILVLRPLHVVAVVFAIHFLFKRLWLWLIASIAALLYLGITGSSLHPFQSAAQLAGGPIKGRAAELESQQLTHQDEQSIIGPACTRVGIVIAFFIGVLLWARFELSWYFALAIACVTVVFAGAILKLVFKAI